jgi:hypothetical protein
MEIFTLYLLMQLDAINVLLGLITGAFLSLVAIWVIIKTVCNEHLILPPIRYIVLILSLMFITTLLPTSKQATILVASSIGLDAVRSPEGQEVLKKSGVLIGKAGKVLEKSLDDILNEEAEPKGQPSEPKEL